MATRMQQRRGTAAQWSGANPILASGEIGFESDTSKFKIGDGVNHWEDLVYYASAAEVASLIDGAPDLLNTLNELAAAVGDDPTFFTTVANNLSAHSSDTTSVHGIANTALLATLTNVDDKIATAATELEGYADTAVSNHSADTTNVHGIADTSVLATQTDATDAATSAVGAHNSDTTNVHGIADTSALALSADLDTHANDTLNVHGIANTADLVTVTDLNAALASAAGDMSAQAGVGIDWNTVSEAFDIDSTVATKTYADDAVGSHNSSTVNVHGIADTSALALTSDLATKQDKVTGVSDTEIGYLDGVTSAIQTQLNGKAASSHSHAQSDITNLTTDLAAKAPLANPTFTGTVNAANVTITGDLTVEGTTTTVSAQDLVVSDPLIYIGEGNTANLVDLGIVSNFNDGTYQHSGIVRDSSAGKWKIFKGVTDEPTTTVNFAQGTLDDLAVKNIEVTGVVFSDGTQSKEGVPSRTPIIQKTASYTLSALTERDSLIEVASSSATTLTIPTDANLALPIGTSIDVLQTSTGQVTIAGAAGVTVNATPGLKLRTTWSSATLFKRAANTWVVYGDLTA